MASLMLRQWGCPGNLMSQVCLPVDGRRLNNAMKKERKCLLLLLNHSSARFLKNSLHTPNLHIYCHPLPCLKKTLRFSRSEQISQGCRANQTLIRIELARGNVDIWKLLHHTPQFNVIWLLSDLCHVVDFKLPGKLSCGWDIHKLSISCGYSNR